MTTQAGEERAGHPSEFIKMNQSLKVLPPKESEGYCISTDEWDYIKGKIKSITTSTNPFDITGSIIGGGGISLLITILSGTFSTQSKLYIAIVSVVAVFIIAALCFLFSYLRHNDKSSSVADVIERMEIIEKRFKPNDDK